MRYLDLMWQSRAVSVLKSLQQLIFLKAVMFMQYATLANGVKMPVLGYGVFKVMADECERCVLDAISVGNRLIDTAQAYGNEDAVGNTIAKSGVKREEFFIVTKIWLTNSGYERASASINESLKKLRSDYVDLLLIHQPFGDYYGTYRAMQEAYKSGKARAIGVSNFYPDRLFDLCHFVEIKPMVNQVETHVFSQQRELRDLMVSLGVQPMSWAPFAEGRKDYFTNLVLVDLAKKYSKTPAQIALRYLLGLGVIVIPKSTHVERMRENFNVLDFELSAPDMARVAALNEGENLIGSHHSINYIEHLFGSK